MTTVHQMLLISAAALGGCNLAPPHVQPEPPIPLSWPVGDAYLQQRDAALPKIDYRDIFRDPPLQSIMTRALANNRDLRIAAANIAAARAQYRVQRAPQFPQINASTGVSLSERASNPLGGTNNTLGGVNNVGVADEFGDGNAPAFRSGGVTERYDVQVGLSVFEIDLFGRLRNLSTAARNELFATEAAARTTRLALIAEIASVYLTLATDRSLLAIAIDTEASAERTVMLTRARLIGGVAPRSDLRQAETVLAQARYDRAALITAIAQDANALDLLAGAPVADYQLPTSLESVEAALSELPAGLDSRILLRRPDVVQAEFVLHAANAEIGAARAAFFPTIGLTAVAGLASSALSSLFSGGAFAWSIGPAATLPIFDGGANAGNLAFTRAERDRALARYEQVIQVAFREVADALAERGTIEQQLAAQRELERAARDAYRLTDARYRAGIDPFLNSLDAQRSLYSAQRTLVGARLDRAQNLVTLYRVLGGDALAEDRTAE